MAARMYQAPKGEARREAILRAALELIGERGTDAVTHRAVAQRAGVPLSATTYWFSSKEELLEETLLLGAREETERLERLVLDLVDVALDDTAAWADALAGELARDVQEDPGRHVALYELVLEATRRPALRPELARVRAAHLRLAELGLRAAGAPAPEVGARIIVSTLTGLILDQLAEGDERFEDEVLRPALGELFARLVAAAPAAA